MTQFLSDRTLNSAPSQGGGGLARIAWELLHCRTYHFIYIISGERLETIAKSCNEIHRRNDQF